MGYNTDFDGSFKLNKPLDNNIYESLVKLNATRRMKRNVPSEYGVEGEFYFEDDQVGIVHPNEPPETQPSLWCGWIPSDDKKEIVWDGGEKFYEYERWILYIIKNFLAPNNYVLNGIITFQGEDDSDAGELIIKDNVLYLTEVTLSPPKIFSLGGKIDQLKILSDIECEKQMLLS